jgi:hypothetical protein
LIIGLKILLGFKIIYARTMPSLRYLIERVV